ncbi:MAG TPA: amidohydrolase family protein [Bauldia sp.]|nr:amidohydrolase family protein [Bauldia sp.]
MAADREIAELVERTPLADTHEHLIEESMRLAGTFDQRLLPCDDWSYLLLSYVKDDLANAGMAPDTERRFFSPDVSTEEKYRLVAPYWERSKHSGYAQAVRYTLRGLYGEDDLTAGSAPRIAEKYRDGIRPGFYGEVLKKANIETCQVNSLQRIFMETEQPELLTQDLSILPFGRAAPADFAMVAAETGRRPDTLDDWLDIIDWYFATYGSKAVAVKSQIAYSRPLDFAPVAREQAARLFRHHVGKVAGAHHPLGPDDLKALQDFLLRYCVGKAGEYGLPVKLHTGYLAGRDLMQLGRLKNHASDLCRLLGDFPEVRFVLMHIGYPYQDEFIALAKHYRNAVIDMCWAWIINPAASVRFLKELLMAAPTNKVLTFGGDYVAVEPIYGHAVVARRGIARAVSELIGEGWLRREEAGPLVEAIMRGNAAEMFPKPQIA